MSQMSLAASPVTPSAQGWRWQRFVGLLTAAVLTLLGLLTGAAPTASADTPAATSDAPTGSVTGWGKREHLDLPSSLRNTGATAIAASANHGLAITPDAKVVTWGVGDAGLPDVPASLADETVTAIAAGGNHDLALTADGKVTAWGENAYGQTDVPASLDGRTVTAISGGGLHSLALTSDGAVIAWGYEGSGQTAVPASLDGKTVTAIAAGFQHSLALTSDGRVTAWGADSLGQADVPASLEGSTVTAIAAGFFTSVALTPGLSPVVTVSPSDTRVTVGTETTLTAAATGDPAPTVQWQRAADGGDFEDVPGATSAAYTFTPAAADDRATFRAVFTNAYGSDSTFGAWLTLNDLPSATDLDVTAGFGSATPVTLSSTGDDGDVLTYSVLTQPTHGTLSGNAPALTYTADDGFSGEDSFTYQVGDGTDSSAPATVSITVTKKPNAAPTAKNLEVEAGFESATPITLSGTDDDGDHLTYAVVAEPVHGTLSDDAPALTYTPQAGYSGDDTFTYRVTDGSEDSTATVELTVAPQSCVPATPKREFTVNVDEREADGPVRTSKFTTKKEGELLLAFVSADGGTTDAQSVTGVSGGGLTWTLVDRENELRGTSEVWQAYAAKKLRSTRVEVDLAEKGRSATVTVAGFSRAQTAAGSSTHATGTSSAPQVTLTPQATGSSIWAVGRAIGSRYDAKPVSGQKIVHAKTVKSPRTGYWTQRVRAASDAGADVTVEDKAEAASWGYAAVEVQGACR